MSPLYRPILDDDQHILDSKKTKGRIRGLARDKNNKNPTIPEFEVVSEEELRAEYGSSPAHSVHSKMETAADALATVQLLLELANQIAVFFQDHPEILIAISETFKKAGNAIGKFFETVWVSFVTTISKPFQKKKDAVPTKATVLALPEKVEHVNDLSNEQARSIIYKILGYYIGMKQELSRLNDSTVNGENIPAIDFESLLDNLQTMEQAYPGLMDAGTRKVFNQLLEANPNKSENKKIKEALRI